jgi:diguanylate cyclase (GGDEF)-like protein
MNSSRGIDRGRPTPGGRSVANDLSMAEAAEASGSSAPMLLRVATDLGRAEDEYEAAQLVVHSVMELLAAPFVAVYLIRFDGSIERAVAAGSLPSPAAAVEELARLALAGNDIICADAPLLSSLELDSSEMEALACPLPLHGPPVAALVLVTASAQAPLPSTLVDAIIEFAGSALTNVRRVREAFAEARVDSLTGLGNRRAFDEQLESLIPQRPSQARRSITLVVSDLDDFKSINDTNGHAAGDEVLRLVARTFLGSVRTTDPMFRIGGDEFALLIEGEQHLGARIANRLCRAVAAQRRGRRLPSVSAGIASWPSDAHSRTELLRRADLALYAAKNDGKSGATCYTSELDPQR